MVSETITLEKFAQRILWGDSLAEKLLDPNFIIKDSFKEKFSLHKLPQFPARANQLQMCKDGQGKSKFPSLHSLQQAEKKAQAIHFFANHELMAIEMFAAACLIFPQQTESEQRFKRALVMALQDEQKHFKMYRQCLLNLGHDFGDFPLSGYFWKYMQVVRTPQQFLAMMSLTFEGANLDFASFYATFFAQIGDKEISEVLKTVYADEITHVALGVRYLNLWRGDEDLWSYYRNHLPFPLTPARARGLSFLRHSRQEAGLPEDFITALQEYEDDFRITKRKNKTF